MALMAITNNNGILDAIKRYHERCGFTNYTESKINDFNIIVWGKIRGGKPHLLHLEGDKVIAGVGTFVRDGKTGEELLNKIITEYDGQIDKLQESLVGNYFFTIINNNTGVCFSDYTESFKVYYWSKDGKWIISNSLAGIVESVGGLEIDMNPLIEFCFQFAIMGSDTYIKNVKKLLGDEHLILSKEGISVLRHPWVKTADSVELSPSHREVSEELIRATKEVISAFGRKMGVHATGGLDSRLILAAMLTNGIRPTLLYGESNSPFIDTKTDDWDIVRALSQHLEIDSDKLDWSANHDDLIRTWSQSYMRTGLFRQLMADKVYDIYKEGSAGSYSFLEAGYFGERLRNNVWLDNHIGDTITVDEYLDDFFINSALKEILPNFLEFRAYLKEKIIRFGDRFGATFQNESFVKGDFQKLHDLYRRDADTYFMNYLNLFTNSCIILTSPKLFRIVYNIPTASKKDGAFMLRIMKNTYPDVLSVPFYSRNRKKTYSKLSGTLKPKIGLISFVDVYRKLRLDKSRTITAVAFWLFEFEPIKKMLIGNKWSEEMSTVPMLRKTLVDIAYEHQGQFDLKLDFDKFNPTYINTVAIYAQLLIRLKQSRMCEENSI